MDFWQVLNPGPSASLRVTLDQGESVRAESDAMFAMSQEVDIGGSMGEQSFLGQ